MVLWDDSSRAIHYITLPYSEILTTEIPKILTVISKGEGMKRPVAIGEYTPPVSPRGNLLLAHAESG